jgi:hypothetical protein
VFLRTGLTPGWFDRHVSVVQVSLPILSRQVLWKLVVGPYTAMLDDVVGGGTLPGGKRYDIHGVDLNCAHDVVNVMSREEAERLLTRCLKGPFEVEKTVFEDISDPGPGTAHLWLTARSVTRSTPSVWTVGFVDVQSGKCVRQQESEPPPGLP